MTIKAGALLHFGREILIQRMPDGGVQQPQINRTKLHELGNWLAVGSSKGTPQVPFNLNSFDVSTDIECLLTGVEPGSLSAGQYIDLADAKPLDIIGPWKDPTNDEDADAGIISPYQLLTGATYRFGVGGQPPQQQFTLQSDSLYFVTQGVPRSQTYAEAGVGPYTFDNTPAVKTVETGDDVYAYSVCLIHADGSFDRLFHGEDYTDTNGGFTLLEAPETGDVIHVTYASDDGPEQFPQSIHASTLVKPADIPAASLKLYISDGAATPALLFMRGIQNAEFTQRFARTAVEELGNAHYASYDAETPETSGSFAMIAANVQYLMQRIAQFLGVPYGETANALADTPLEMALKIEHPDTGEVLKTLWVPDAVITPPGTNATANQNYTQTFNWTGESGEMRVYEGDLP